MITQDELKQLFTYSKRTGEFRYRVARGKSCPGDVAKSKIPIGYLRVFYKKKSYYLHRLAFLYVTGRMPIEVDHRNGVKHDNRWSNLRPAARLDNVGNCGKRRHNTTGLKGVFKAKYGFTVRCGGSYVGSSKCPRTAAQMYDSAAVKHFGQFAKTNALMGLL